MNTKQAQVANLMATVSKSRPKLEHVFYFSIALLIQVADFLADFPAL